MGFFEQSMGNPMRTFLFFRVTFFLAGTAFIAPVVALESTDTAPLATVSTSAVEPAGSGLSSCVKGSDVAAPEQIAAFRADAVAFVNGVLATGQDLSDVIGNLVMQDPTLVVSPAPDAESPGDSPMLALVKSMGEQKYAFARGLGLASTACVTEQPDVAVLIQELAASVPDTTFQSAFLVAIEDIRTAALNAGSGEGGGDIGSGGEVGGALSGEGVAQDDGQGLFTTPSAGSRSTTTTTNLTQTRTENETVSTTSIGGL